MNNINEFTFFNILRWLRHYLFHDRSEQRRTGISGTRGGTLAHQTVCERCGLADLEYEPESEKEAK